MDKMPRYIPIKEDSLVLIEQEIKTKKVVTKKGPVNHLWIYDRSGSMSWALPELTKQLIDLSKKLPKGDSLSLGWFSSEGNQYNWIFKGFRIVDNADYKMLEAAIKQNSHALGCTCFSEILSDTDQVIKDLTVLSKIFSLHFFTDGYPVVSNYQKEISSIFSAIKKIKGRIQTAMFVGYGHGYNKELLSSMAEKLGAMLIHSSMIPEYASSITKLISLTDNSEPKEELDPLISKPLSVFTITDQGIVIYTPDDDGKLYISPTKGNSTKVYYLSNEKPNKKSWDKLEVSDINFGDNNDQISQAMYAAALVMTQQTKSDVALEILGKIGDKSLIDSLNNAFQVEEYGAVEETINKTIQDVGLRFSSGRDVNYLPPTDAFCVFDALNTLLDDDEAAFFPYHEKFKYERIGVASTAKDDFAKFIPDKKSKCPFNNMVWHESRLNLSIQFFVPGTIDLKDREGTTAQSLGLPVPYPTFVYRNFSFVKDGHTHIKTFYITSSEETYKVFKNKGIVVDDTFKSDKVYGVDISKLPAINRKIAEGKTSATDLCKAVLQEHRLKAQIKALKYLKGQEVPVDAKESGDDYEDAQRAFLKANGVSIDRDGSYSPPTVKADPVDFYMAKYFDIALSGIATLPTVKKVQEKIASGKARTPSETLLEVGINAWNARKGSLSGDAAKMKWFNDTIKNLQNQMKALRVLIQQNKFAVLLGKAWYQEFTSRENCEITIDGVNCVFKLGEEKVPV
jgi:hypothetical protein